MAHDDRTPRDPSKPRGRRAAPAWMTADAAEACRVPLRIIDATKLGNTLLFQVIPESEADANDRSPRAEVHVCIHADGTEHELRAGEGCDEWVARHVVAAPAVPDGLCSDVVLDQLGRDLADLRAGQDAMLADHDAIVDNLRRRLALQRGVIERAHVVAEALPRHELPPLGGALTIGERTSWEEGWDNAMRAASEFILAALRAQR